MKLSDLGFKYFSREFDWALPNGNVRVEESHQYKGFWSLELDKNFKSSKYDHLLFVTRIPKASLMKFLENNIEGLKEFDKSPNKKFVNKIKDEVRSLSKPLRFKNMWMDYNFKMPSNATKGILYELDSWGNNGFAKKVESVIVPILSKTIFSKAITDDFMSGNGDQTFFETKKKDRKVALDIPYIKRINKKAQKEAEDFGDDPNDYGYEGAVLMSNYYIGKVKGIGKDATLYYFVLLMGCDMEDDIADPAVCVEVITPLEKGENFFLNEVKNAVAKFNPLKFSGKKIYVNKCPKSVTDSAESKVFAYHGQVITASSKEDAIKKIVSKNIFEMGLELKDVWKGRKEQLVKLCSLLNIPSSKIHFGERPGSEETRVIQIVIPTTDESIYNSIFDLLKKLPEHDTNSGLMTEVTEKDMSFSYTPRLNDDEITINLKKEKEYITKIVNILKKFNPDVNIWINKGKFYR